VAEAMARGMPRAMTKAMDRAMDVETKLRLPFELYPQR